MAFWACTCTCDLFSPLAGGSSAGLGRASVGTDRPVNASAGSAVAFESALGLAGLGYCVCAPLCVHAYAVRRAHVPRLLDGTARMRQRVAAVVADAADLEEAGMSAAMHRKKFMAVLVELMEAPQFKS